MTNKGVRWKQRFHNYQKALSQLQKFIDKGDLNELEEQGLIQAFEYTYELAWNVMKDFFKEKGVQNIFGSRDAITEAFKQDIITDGECWMNMIKDRNQTSHTYNEETAERIAANITGQYHEAFRMFEQKMLSLS
mgnify:FL=1